MNPQNKEETYQRISVEDICSKAKELHIDIAGEEELILFNTFRRHLLPWKKFESLDRETLVLYIDALIDVQGTVHKSNIAQKIILNIFENRISPDFVSLDESIKIIE